MNRWQLKAIRRFMGLQKECLNLPADWNSAPMTEKGKPVEQVKRMGRF